MRKTIYLLCAFISLSAATVVGQKKAFAIEDLYKVRSVGAPALSPDGMHIAFTVTNSDLQKGKSLTDIYVMDSDGQNKNKLPLPEKETATPPGQTIVKVYTTHRRHPVAHRFICTRLPIISQRKSLTFRWV